MTIYDELFEGIQSLSDDAHEAGLADVALVLEFALDVLLRDSEELSKQEPTPAEVIVAAAEKLKAREFATDTTRQSEDGSKPVFPLLSAYRVAS